MPGQQVPDVVQARWDAAAGAVVGYLQPKSYDRTMVIIAVSGGPGGSTLNIYRGYRIDATQRISSVFPADTRTYTDDGGRVLKIYAGSAATFAWTGGQSGASSTATATITSEVD